MILDEPPPPLLPIVLFTKLDKAIRPDEADEVPSVKSILYNSFI
tara:strand:- start:156 stop:287 length:132 start_codon:yes stop_codon:yes gene_type:complete